MQHDNVIIAEGSLPHCAQVRAVEHERRRSKALVLRERAEPVKQTAADSPEDEALASLPELPPRTAPSLPSLFAGQPASSPLPDDLPDQGPNGAAVRRQALPWFLWDYRPQLPSLPSLLSPSWKRSRR